MALFCFACLEMHHCGATPTLDAAPISVVSFQRRPNPADLHLADRCGKSACFEDIGGEFGCTASGLMPVGMLLILNQEGRCLLDEIKRLRRKAVGEVDAYPRCRPRLSASIRRLRPTATFAGSRWSGRPPSWRSPSHSSKSAKNNSASSSASSQALTTSGRCSISACGIAMKPPSSSSTEAPLATLRARPSCTRRDAVGSQITAASNFLARKPLVMTSMLWLRYSDGLMPFF